MLKRNRCKGIRLNGSKQKFLAPGLSTTMYPVSDDVGDIGILLERLYQEHGADFRQYNRATLIRRLSKRLRVRKVQTYEDYARILDRDAGEWDKLLDVFTVNQTSFFRNPAVFEIVKRKLMILLGRREREKKPLRIWCAGCSTGQEPYSFAILLNELVAEGYSSAAETTIIASDIDSKALEYAQKGIYTEKETESLPEELRAKYMQFEKGGSHCSTAIRKLIRFEQHSMTAEPGFENIDLLACRNVIIYFLTTLQMQVFRSFYRSLQADGLLLLGDSEIPMREARGLFTCLDFESKLYHKAVKSRNDRN